MIKIYEKEIADGIGTLVQSTASIAYCSEATLHKSNFEAAKSTITNQDVLDRVLAENKDQVDLYYLESVLVSTGWNKNDDVFVTQATWNARNTPEDKQFNFMHDENDIIGHITGSYVLTKDGKAIADGAEMPEEFDIITQAVLYNSWTNSENRERMEQIISEIGDGKWFVSMECLFAGFNYALIGPDGEAKILARDEDSSFLTKHLRAYGGTGEYEGHKIGRALANIAFSGKGLVSKPANPRSIILNSKSTAQFNVKPNSQLSIGDINMSDTSLLEKQLADVQAQLAEAKDENDLIKAKIEEAKDKEFASQSEAYEVSATKSQATIAELEETIKSTQARVAELEDALTTSQTELSEAMSEMNEMKAHAKLEQRKAALVEAGLSEEEVAERISAFRSLDDEAFEAVIALWPPKKDDKKKKDKEKEDKDAEAEVVEAEEAEVTAEVFEEVESSEATLVETETEEYDEVQATRASVAEWIEKNVLSK
jgi:hypothetical protein